MAEGYLLYDHIPPVLSLANKQNSVIMLSSEDDESDEEAVGNDDEDPLVADVSALLAAKPTDRIGAPTFSICSATGFTVYCERCRQDRYH